MTMCQTCNVRMTCVETKQYNDSGRDFGYVQRRKVCPKCNARVHTIEITRDEFNDLVRKANEKNS